MGAKLPEPLSLLWELKPVSSATAWSETMVGGGGGFKHDVLKGVTPAILVWWFGHLEGDVEIDGRVLNRCRVWHPSDHVSARYVRCAPDGTIGSGRSVVCQNPPYGPLLVTSR